MFCDDALYKLTTFTLYLYRHFTQQNVLEKIKNRTHTTSWTSRPQESHVTDNCWQPVLCKPSKHYNH